jgi:hypothetical protein
VIRVKIGLMTSTLNPKPENFWTFVQVRRQRVQEPRAQPPRGPGPASSRPGTQRRGARATARRECPTIAIAPRYHTCNTSCGSEISIISVQNFLALHININVFKFTRKAKGTANKGVIPLTIIIQVRTFSLCSYISCGRHRFAAKV